MIYIFVSIARTANGRNLAHSPTWHKTVSCKFKQHLVFVANTAAFPAMYHKAKVMVAATTTETCSVYLLDMSGGSSCSNNNITKLDIFSIVQISSSVPFWVLLLK